MKLYAGQEIEAMKMIFTTYTLLLQRFWGPALIERRLVSRFLLSKDHTRNPPVLVMKYSIFTCRCPVTTILLETGMWKLRAA
jgi:hypothetical protein